MTGTRVTGTPVYTSTTTGALPAAVAAVASTAIALVVLLLSGAGAEASTVGAVVVALAALAAARQLATVRLTISACGVGLGMGLAGRTRWIALADVVDARRGSLSWPQVYGLGLPLHRRTTRATVRRGPTLVLQIGGGRDTEQLRISTADPGSALRVLHHYTSSEDSGRTSS